MGGRRSDYGFDSPYVPAGLAAASVLALGVAALAFETSVPALAGLGLAISAVFALSTLSFIWTTRRGKFVIWNKLLDDLALRGDERLLDVGCGRGAVLLLAARRLPAGRAVGIDLWSTTDQSGNGAQATLRNAQFEGVEDRIELHTADMRRLPFPDETFDVVTSSLAIHNIGEVQGREQALSEIVRVLKKGGTAMIADFRCTAEYERHCSARLGAAVRRQRLGWQFWYGGPQAATTLVRVHRPL